jgi:hypothetical protein
LTCPNSQIVALTGENPKLENTCPKDNEFDSSLSDAPLQDGQLCKVKCPATYDQAGAWICSAGEVVGDAGCVERTGDAQSKEASLVAGKVQASMSTTSTVEGWAANLVEPFTTVLETQMRSVKVQDLQGNIVSNTSGYAGRRLQSGSGDYFIAYEAVILSGSLISPEFVAKKATALATAGSQAQSDFLTAATSKGLTLSNIAVKIAPRVVQTTVAVNSLGVLQKYTSLPDVIPAPATTSTEVTETADVGAIVGGVLGGLVGLFCIGGCCWAWCLMRKRMRES